LLPCSAGAVPLSLGFSLGQEIQLQPGEPGQARQTSLMFAPGYQLGPELRLELGLLITQDSDRDGQGDIEVRPNIVYKMLGFDYFARINAGFAHLWRGDKGEQQFAPGLAFGRDAAFGSMPVFAEVGITSRREKGKRGMLRAFWLAEVRVGGVYSFAE